MGEFEAALQTQSSPNTRLYLALSLRNLGRAVLAYRELQRAADEADQRAVSEPRYSRTAQIARSERANTASRVALITLAIEDVVDGLVVRLNGNRIETTAWNVELPFEPGELIVDAEAPGRPPFHTTATLAAGTRSQIAVRFDAAPRPDLSAIGATQRAQSEGWAMRVQPSGRRRASDDSAGVSGRDTAAGPAGPSALVPVGGVMMAVGGVAILGGAITGAIAASQHATLNVQCPEPSASGCVDLPARVTAGNTLVTLTNVGLIGGAGVAAVGLTLFLVGRLTSTAASEELPSIARRRPRAVPGMDFRAGVVGLQGAF